MHSTIPTTELLSNQEIVDTRPVRGIENRRLKCFSSFVGGARSFVFVRLRVSPHLGGVEELAAEVGGAWVGFGEPDLGFLAEVGAPGGVLGEEAAAETDEDGGVEGVDGVGRGPEAHPALARWRTRCSRRLRTLSLPGGESGVQQRRQC
ncbi:hypothetical protein Syun_005897 [Stephania yunnanensis]|uniref:Uncharacterized protein n=1 Tax=Stephania yunnanensis TaxID=152371 RepID=A0AAP0KVY3_9MAGN